MLSEIEIRLLDPTDNKCIETIAQWYHQEWNTPLEKTRKRLSAQPNQDLYFQWVAYHQDKAVATGGLGETVNLLKVHSRFKKIGPWVALLYTAPGFRNQGLGKAILERIEQRAAEHQLDKIYLYTFTAATLYEQSGWKFLEQVDYKGHPTWIMGKLLR